jgi:hypothetical protein
METLAERGDYAPPTLESLEEVFAYGLGLRQGRVFVDLWDVEKLSSAAQDKTARIDRLAAMNLSQTLQ